jgi:dTDP-4-amino-4,6-dideoxygalactose transaminase
MTYRIPLLDLTRHHARIAADIDQAWREALAGMRLLNGEQVRQFEREIAAYTGVPHACGVASGTDALLLGLAALGIGRGDRVVLPANAFVAALTVVHHLGAVPILVDAAAEGFGPDLDAIAAALPARAVLVVHLFGHALALDAVHRLCIEGNASLVEDCSHAHGARRAGRHVGSTGAVGCFSAGVVKNLGAYGDAGFVITHDPATDTVIRQLRTQGQERKNEHVRYGYTSRLDELQAAVLRVKLRDLETRNCRRRAIAVYYNDRFAPLGIRVPSAAADESPVYHQYVIRTAERDRLRAALAERGIETGIHYPVPLHRQEAWLRTYGMPLSLPRAERLASEVLSLPVFPELGDAEVEAVAAAVHAFYGRATTRVAVDGAASTAVAGSTS